MTAVLLREGNFFQKRTDTPGTRRSRDGNDLSTLQEQTPVSLERTSDFTLLSPGAVREYTPII